MCAFWTPGVGDHAPGSKADEDDSDEGKGKLEPKLGLGDLHQRECTSVGKRLECVRLAVGKSFILPMFKLRCHAVTDMREAKRGIRNTKTSANPKRPLCAVVSCEFELTNVRFCLLECVLLLSSVAPKSHVAVSPAVSSFIRRGYRASRALWPT